jgi:acyl-CoA reductase-like NAD-dependent aldehyde dehydrogenase
MNEVELLADLAMEVEAADPIDWGMLSINERDAYLLMAASVIDRNDDQLTNKAVIVKLLVENFVLNLKLMGKLT